ncbi:MAG: gamma-glutamylcyclotransferase [Reyranellaceae bacterium]
MPRVRYPASSVTPIAARPAWVFAYGSLMWDPGFTPPETRPARLAGWHRAFCIKSEHYRGTPKVPGLILGLLPGGACRGLAHRLPDADYDAIRRYLWDREILNDGVYFETVRPLALDDGTTVEALLYLANREHPGYLGKLPLDQAAALVRQGEGVRGRCLDYVANTVMHLDALGLRESHLHALLEAARR